MFEIMAQELKVWDLPSNSVDEETHSASRFNEDSEQKTFLFPTENNSSTFDDNEAFPFQSDDSASCGGSADVQEPPAVADSHPVLKAKNAAEKNHTSAGLGLNAKLFIAKESDDKENEAVPAPAATGEVLSSKWYQLLPHLSACCCLEATAKCLLSLIDLLSL